MLAKVKAQIEKNTSSTMRSNNWFFSGQRIFEPKLELVRLEVLSFKTSGVSHGATHSEPLVDFVAD